MILNKLYLRILHLHTSADMIYINYESSRVASLLALWLLISHWSLKVSNLNVEHKAQRNVLN
jgi:hypothetical protein